MSTVQTETEQTPLPTFKKRLPAEVNNLLSAWWLALGLGAFVLVAVWQIILGAVGEFLGPNASLSGLAGWGVLGGIVLVLLLVGMVVSSGLAKGRRLSLRLFKLAIPLGLLLGLAAVGGLIYLLIAPDSKFSLQPRPVLAGVLWCAAALLPFLFSGLAYSLSWSEGVQRFFGLRCPKCGSANVVGNDSLQREMRCRETECGYIYTSSEPPPEEPEVVAEATEDEAVVEEAVAEEEAIAEPTEEDFTVEAARDGGDLFRDPESDIFKEEGSIFAGDRSTRIATPEELEAALHGDEAAEDADALFRDDQSGIFKKEDGATAVAEAEEGAEALFQDAESGLFKEEAEVWDAEAAKGEGDALFQDDESGLFKPGAAEAEEVLPVEEAGPTKEMAPAQDIARETEAAQPLSPEESAVLRKSLAKVESDSSEHDILAEAEAAPPPEDPRKTRIQRVAKPTMMQPTEDQPATPAAESKEAAPKAPAQGKPRVQAPGKPTMIQPPETVLGEQSPPASGKPRAKPTMVQPQEQERKATIIPPKKRDESSKQAPPSGRRLGKKPRTGIPPRQKPPKPPGEQGAEPDKP